MNINITTYRKKVCATSYKEARSAELSLDRYSVESFLLRVFVRLYVLLVNIVIMVFKGILFNKCIDNVKSIYIYTVGSLGDNVLMLPAISAIRRRYPSAQITAITNCDGFSDHPAREIIGNSSFVDRHIPLPDHPVQRRGRKLVVEFPENERACCDLFVNLSPFGNRGWSGAVIREMLFARWLGARSTIGFRVSSYNRRGIFNSVQHYFVENEARRCRRVLKELELSQAEDEDLLPRDVNAQERVREVLANHASGQRPIFVLNPGAKLKASHWPADRFGQVASWLVKTYDAFVVINGTAAELDLCDRVVKAADGLAVNLAGELSIQELVELLRLSACCITNNTGPMTLSAMVGIPQVVIASTRFSPTFYMPISSKMIWLFSFTAQSYSYDDSLENPEDLMNIEVSDVMRAVCELVPQNKQ